MRERGTNRENNRDKVVFINCSTQIFTGTSTIVFSSFTNKSQKDNKERRERRGRGGRRKRFSQHLCTSGMGGK